MLGMHERAPAPMAPFDSPTVSKTRVYYYCSTSTPFSSGGPSPSSPFSAPQSRKPAQSCNISAQCKSPLCHREAVHWLLLHGRRRPGGGCTGGDISAPQLTDSVRSPCTGSRRTPGTRSSAASRLNSSGRAEAVAAAERWQGVSCRAIARRLAASEQKARPAARWAHPNQSLFAVTAFWALSPLSQVVHVVGAAWSLLPVDRGAKRSVRHDQVCDQIAAASGSSAAQARKKQQRQQRQKRQRLAT
eukprot:SAG31_NODE_9697_length_1240_cov_1.556529_1_plen_245_part_00